MKKTQIDGYKVEFSWIFIGLNNVESNLGLEDEIMAEKTARWDFDFRRGVPLHSSNLPGPSTSSVIYEALDTKNVGDFY